MTMVGLSIPDDFPLSSLITQELVQVCIGPHQVQLRFDQVSKTVISLQPQWEPGAAIDIELVLNFVVPGLPLNRDQTMIWAPEQAVLQLF